MSRRISVSQHQKIQFIPLPMMFYTDDHYKSMSEDAKIAYALLKNRHSLSIKNGWIDETGHIYFVYSNKELMSVLNCSEDKVTKIKKVLEKNCLLEQERVGFNQPNRLYLLDSAEKDSRRISVSQHNHSQFIRLPLVFFTNDLYKSMSNSAKTAYALLQNRHELSIKNNWVDDEGNIYFIYTVHDLMEMLSCASEKATKIKKELITLGLLEQERIGQNKANRLYLLEPESPETKGTPEIENPEPLKSKIQNSGNRKSRTPEIENPEPLKSKPSYIDISYSDISYININQSTLGDEIEKSALPMPIKKTLMKNIDRLINDKISVNDIEEHWVAHESVINDGQYADACNFALVKTNGKIKNIKARMTRAVQDKLKVIQSMASETGSKPVRKDKLPKWMIEQEKQTTEKKQSQPSYQEELNRLLAERKDRKKNIDKEQTS